MYPVAAANSDFFKTATIHRLSSLPVPNNEDKLAQLDVDNVVVTIDNDSSLVSAFIGCNLKNEVLICDLENHYSSLYTKCYSELTIKQNVKACPMHLSDKKDNFCFLHQVSK